MGSHLGWGLREKLWCPCKYVLSRSVGVLLDSAVQRDEGTRRGRLWPGHANGGSRESRDELCYGPFSINARNGIPHGQISPFCCCQQVRLMSLGLVTADAGFVWRYLLLAWVSWDWSRELIHHWQWFLCMLLWYFMNTCFISFSTSGFRETRYSIQLDMFGSQDEHVLETLKGCPVGSPLSVADEGRCAVNQARVFRRRVCVLCLLW